MYKGLVKEHSKLASSSKLVEDKNKKLVCDLRDAKDSAELLEFRLLELEQRESRERTPDLPRKIERATETDNVSLNSFNGDSGCSSLTSVDELLDIQKDFRVSFYMGSKVLLWSGKVEKSCYCRFTHMI